MAIIHEDGTIVSGAQSYVSMSYADDYHSKHGNTAWAAATEPDREVALREGTSWIDARFKRLWQGWRVDKDQPLDFPRQEVYYPDGWLVGSTVIPRDLKDAVCEAALRALSGDLDPDLARGGRVKSQSVGPLSRTFQDDAPPGTVYQRIENLLSWLVSEGSASQVKVQRG